MLKVSSFEYECCNDENYFSKKITNAINWSLIIEYKLTSSSRWDLISYK
jgi:hypothetical protein